MATPVMSQNKFGENPNTKPVQLSATQSSFKMPESHQISNEQTKRSNSAQAKPMFHNNIQGPSVQENGYSMKMDPAVAQPSVVNIKKIESANQQAFNFDNKVLPQVQQMMQQLQNNRQAANKSAVAQKEQINF